MPKAQECTDNYILTKKLFLAGLRGLQSISNPVERPCICIFLYKVFLRNCKIFNGIFQSRIQMWHQNFLDTICGQVNRTTEGVNFVPVLSLKKLRLIIWRMYSHSESRFTRTTTMTIKLTFLCISAIILIWLRSI